MKLLPLILSLTIIGAPAYATPGGEGNNGNCNGVGNPNSPCNPGSGGGGGGNGNPPGGPPVSVPVVNSNANSNTNYNENTNTNRNVNTQRQNQSQRVSVRSVGRGGAGGQGGQGGQGGAGGQGGQASSRSSSIGQGGQGGRSSSQAQGGASSSDASSGSTSAARSGQSKSNVSVRDNSVNNYTSYDERETAIAPLLQHSDNASMDGVVAPLPTLGFSGFATRGDSLYGDRDDYGFSLGVRVPLGADRYHRAAQRRDLFRATQEALRMRNQGILDQEAHPEHWEALYGPTEASEEPSETAELPIRR